MPYQLTVSPDFSPTHLSGWHIFNTWLQKSLGEGVHLELYDSFESQREAILADKVDLIYANPYDASVLVREKGFLPAVKPQGKSDEAVVAVNANHPATSVEDLQPGVMVASTADPDIHMMGMIMLEPADLNADKIIHKGCDSYVLVAKAMLRGESDVGFFLEEAFNDLSNTVRNQLRALVSSQIQVVHHALMVGPRLTERQQEIRDVLLKMGDESKGRVVLEGLGLESWEAMDDEEVEFMIDLMSTLVN